MVSNLRAQGVTLLVLALFAVAGFVAVCWLAAGAAERLADWWRDRRIGEEPAGSLDTLACDAEAPDGDLCWFDRGHDGQHAWELRLGLGLAPERTWEQMTSHQLPLSIIEPRPTPADRAMDRYLEARERRPPWWEAEQRAAYQALDLEYPSGLLARVRELTP